METMDTPDTTPMNFNEIRGLAVREGISPLWLLTQDGAQTAPEAWERWKEAAAEDTDERIAERMTDLLAMLSQSRVELGYRQLRTVISELMGHNPSLQTLKILVTVWEFSVEWLFFGLGEPYKPKTGYLFEEGRLTGANLRNFRMKSGLGGVEMLWLWGTTVTHYLNGTKGGQNQELGISASLLLRTLDHNPEIRLLPEPPSYQDILPAVDDALEELDGPAAPAEYRETLELLRKTPAKIAVLFGTNVWSGYIWKSRKQQPRVPVLRLFQTLIHLLQRYGGKGFLRFLDVVDMEVKARGMAGGVPELIKTGIWPGRTEKEGENGES